MNITYEFTLDETKYLIQVLETELEQVTGKNNKAFIETIINKLRFDNKIS